MFGLLKLLAYGLLGYALYEFFRGMSDTGGGGGQGRMGMGMSGGAGNFRSESSAANMTGPGEGMEMSSSDDSGGSVPHRVGRGVVSSS